MDFYNEDSHGFIRSLFNCTLRYERRRINSETNKSHGKVMQKQSGEHKRKGAGGEAWNDKRKKFVFKDSFAKCPEGERGKRKHNIFLEKYNRMDDMVKLLEVDNVDKKNPSLVNL